MSPVLATCRSRHVDRVYEALDFGTAHIYTNQLPRYIGKVVPVYCALLLFFIGSDCGTVYDIVTSFLLKFKIHPEIN
jgi:hypothetical protein